MLATCFWFLICWFSSLDYSLLIAGIEIKERLILTVEGWVAPVTNNWQKVPDLSSKTLVKSLKEYEMLRFYVIFGLC